MNPLGDVLAMDERTYRLWAEQTKGAVFTWTAEAAARLIPAKRSVGSVAVIPLSGFLTQKPSIFSFLFGGTSVREFAREVVAALADPLIGAVVMDVDSPGGEVFGVPEAALQIRAARGAKPLMAVANPIAASAAYWLAAQADEMAVTPSGLAGSIGVFAAHVDESKALEQAGLALTLISYGRRKTEGASTGPLSEDALGAIQARVDAFGRMFEADVVKGRRVSAGKVASDFGEGAVMTAEESVAAGLADRVATLDEVVAKVANGYRPAGVARSADPAELRFRARLAGIEMK
jgi:signal peptide peptidase SppA